MVEEDRLNSLRPPPGCEELGSRALRELTEACSKGEGYVAVDTRIWGHWLGRFTQKEADESKTSVINTYQTIIAQGHDCSESLAKAEREPAVPDPPPPCGAFPIGTAEGPWIVVVGRCRLNR